MQHTERATLRRLKTRTYAGPLVLVMLLSVLGGCATGVKKQALPAPGTAVGEDPSKGPTVAKLEDGREGFIITEAPHMDEASQRDFDHAVALLKDEDYGEAITLLEKVTGKSPGVTAPYVDLAIAYRHTGSLREAEENLKAALELFPEHPVASNEYGLLYRRTGRFAKARAMYEKTLVRFPDYFPAHRNLGILCDLYMNDLSCALEHYEIYGEANPHDEQMKMWIADLRARLGRD